MKKKKNHFIFILKKETNVHAKQAYKRLLIYAWPYSYAVLLGLFGTILISSTDAGFAYILKPLLDKGFIAKDQHFIQLLPLGVFLAFLIRGAGGYMSDYFMARAGRSVVLKFRQEIFAHLLKLHARFFESSSRS